MRSNRSYNLLAVTLIVALVGCQRSSTTPDPESFGPVEDEVKLDPREIVFYNGSVEMAEVEIFAPAAKVEDCTAEAPHRLLCPADYRHIYDKKVYPRTKTSALYPKELPLECAQVWVRVRTKAMQPNEYRQAIFLLPGEGKTLVLELGEGEAARLTQRGISDTNRFPAPLRYCDPDDPSATAAPKGPARSDEQVAKILEGAGAALKSCPDQARTRGLLEAALTLRRDGTVLEAELRGGARSPAQKETPADCLLKTLRSLRFPGFTPTQTTAEVRLRLPLR